MSEKSDPQNCSMISEMTRDLLSRRVFLALHRNAGVEPLVMLKTPRLLTRGSHIRKSTMIISVSSAHLPQKSFAF